MKTNKKLTPFWLSMVTLAANPCSLHAAEKVVDDGPSFEKYLELQTLQDVLLAHTPLPTVLIQLILQYRPPDQEPTWIAYQYHGSDRWQMGSPKHESTITLLSVRDGMPLCRNVWYGLRDDPTPWRDSSLINAMAQRWSIPGEQARQGIKFNRGSINELGIDWDTIIFFTQFLQEPCLVVARNSERYQKGLLRGALLLTPGHTVSDLACVQQLYKKAKSVQSSVGHRLCEKHQDILEQFARSYETHGLAFIQACERVAGRENVDILFGPSPWNEGEEEELEEANDNWAVVE